MTKKQKDMLKRILVTAVLYVALVAADHMKMISAVFTGWKMLFLYLIPYFVIGWDILYMLPVNSIPKRQFERTT